LFGFDGRAHLTPLIPSPNSRLKMAKFMLFEEGDKGGEASKIDACTPKAKLNFYGYSPFRIIPAIPEPYSVRTPLSIACRLAYDLSIGTWIY
jgi:hypothetical protein